MALGSENKLRRKEFQKEAGGSKWKEKITTIAQAQEIIDVLSKHHILDDYTKSKIVLLRRYIEFKMALPADDKLSFKDYFHSI